MARPGVNTIKSVGKAIVSTYKAVKSAIPKSTTTTKAAIIGRAPTNKDRQKNKEFFMSPEEQVKLDVAKGATRIFEKLAAERAAKENRATTPLVTHTTQVPVNLIGSNRYEYDTAVLGKGSNVIQPGQGLVTRGGTYVSPTGKVTPPMTATTPGIISPMKAHTMGGIMTPIPQVDKAVQHELLTGIASKLGVGLSQLPRDISTRALATAGGLLAGVKAAGLKGVAARRALIGQTMSELGLGTKAAMVGAAAGIEAAKYPLSKPSNKQIQQIKKAVSPTPDLFGSLSAIGSQILGAVSDVIAVIRPGVTARVSARRGA